MFPTNNGASLNIIPVKKRRSRKKKDAVVDPEAERQERELRMKIMQSLHTQQVLRTEVEEEEHQRSMKVEANMRGGGVNNFGPDSTPARPSANNIGNLQTMNPLMMGSGMAMGFTGVQSQMGMGGMGGMGVQHQQQQSFQFNDRNQQYGYGDQGASSDMGGTSIPSMQQQMRQMEQQLEMQQQILEQQIKLKQQLEMQRPLQMEQQLEMQQQHLEQQIKLKQQQEIQHSLQHRQMLQSPLRPQNESSLKFGKETKFSSEDIMRSLKYEQEKLLQETLKRDIMNNKVSEASGSQAHLPDNVPSVKQGQAKYQHDENYKVGSPQQNCQGDSNFHTVPLSSKLYKHDGSGMPPGNSSNQKTNINEHGLSNNYQNHLLSMDSSSTFHSVGNKSASFGSTMEGNMGQTAFASSVQNNKPTNVVLGNEGNNRTNDVKPKQTTDEHSNVSSATIVRQSSKCNDNDACSPSIGKGTTDTETNAALQPIQENESGVSYSKKFAQSSVMMSFLEGEFMQSVRKSNMSEANDNVNAMSLNDFVMSMDSMTLENLLKKSGGDMNFSISETDYIIGANEAADQARGGVAMENPTTAQKQEQPMLKISDKSSDELKSTKVNHDNGQGGLDSLGQLSQDGTRVKPGDANFSNPSSLHMDEHNQQKQPQPRLSRNSSQSGVRRSASRKSVVSKISMMSEISQWTMDNPFDDSGGNGDSVAVGDGACNSGSAEKKQEPQLERNTHRDSFPVDMGDFHSLGGSIDNTLDISMMSSMIGDGLSESLAALDISARGTKG